MFVTTYRIILLSAMCVCVWIFFSLSLSISFSLSLSDFFFFLSLFPVYPIFSATNFLYTGDLVMVLVMRMYVCMHVMCKHSRVEL